MSNWLKYYDEEFEIFEKWQKDILPEKPATSLIKKLARYCRISISKVEFKNRGDAGWSWAKGTELYLNADRLTYLLIVHEIAHIWLDILRMQGFRTMGRDHCKDHRDLMIRLFKHIEHKGWDKIAGYIVPRED